MMLLRMSTAALTVGLGAETGLQLGCICSQQLGTLVERHVFGWQEFIGLVFLPHLSYGGKIVIQSILAAYAFFKVNSNIPSQLEFSLCSLIGPSSVLVQIFYLSSLY